MMAPPDFRSAPLLAVLLVASVTMLAGCVSDGANTAAPQENSLTGAARAIGIATSTPEPAEFVRASRPATTPDFIPVGVTPPPRGQQKRDAAAVEKLRQELDAQRNRSRTYAGRPAPRSSYNGKIPPRPTLPPKELTPQ